MIDRTSVFRSPNPHRLYRNPQAGKAFGVCAGIADYFGIDPFLVRVATVLGLVFFFMPVLMGYAVAAIVLKPRPSRLYASTDEEEFWRTVSIKPERSVAGLREKFSDLDRRIGGLESHVTSREFELNRAFRDLDR